MLSFHFHSAQNILISFVTSVSIHGLFQTVLLNFQIFAIFFGISPYFIFFKLNVFIYLFWEREREQAGEGQREKGRQRIPWRLCAVCTEFSAGLEHMNYGIMTCAIIKNQMLNPPSHAGAPYRSYFHLVLLLWYNTLCMISTLFKFLKLVFRILWPA